MAFPKNPYASRLETEFSSFALNEDEVFRYQGGWEEFFLARMGRKPARLVLEIGCSNAEFLTEVAAANPDIAFIGIDWKYKVLYKGAKRVAQKDLKNVALLRCRAQELSRIFTDSELDEIWLFFPDPWAKKSQLKNRLVQEPFLKDAHRALHAGGKVYFKTDHPGYMQWVLALFGKPVPELEGYDEEAPTERSYRARQMKVRKVHSAEDLPGANESIQKMFALENESLNHWKEPRPRTLFSETQTLFEKGFVQDNLPIYYAEFRKK